MSTAPSGRVLFTYIPGVGKAPVIEAPRGPTGATGPAGTAVNTGATGATGATGPNSIPSGFSTINGGSITLTDTFQPISTVSVTTTIPAHILGQASVQCANTGNNDHWVTFYQVVNGSTGNQTTEEVRKTTGGVFGYANLFLIHRSDVTAAGPYTATVYGKVDASVNTVIVDHIDHCVLGNLL